MFEISNNAWLYILSYGLLIASVRSFQMKMMGHRRNPQGVQIFFGFSVITSIALLIWGFISFKWYVPLTAFLVVSFAIQILLNLLFGRSKLVIFIFKDHIGILIGIILSLIALLS